MMTFVVRSTFVRFHWGWQDSAVQQGLSTLDGVGYDGVQPQWETMTESERSSHVRVP